ncbi:MAG: SDR family oxidoreductase [Bacteroidota bacterium]
MNVLITGGAGYVGNELVYRLSKDKRVDKVIIYDNLSRKNFNLFLDNKFPNGKIKFIQGELLDTRKLKSVIQEADIIYHLAAKVSTPLANEDSHLFEQINHWGTAELVYALEDSNVKKIIYLSSTSVYGPSEEIVDIHTTPNPKTFYGTSKLRGEEHIKRISTKIPAYIFRCGNIFGYSPSMRFDAVINRFMFEANFNNRISIHGNGEQHRAFIHIDKVTDVLSNILHSDFPSGIYNLVDGNLSINEIAEALKKIYPSMEMLYINQHLNLREVNVNKDERVNTLITTPDKTLYNRLLDFKNEFSFSAE